MARGGHPHSGPAPDPNALRRDRASDQAGWVTLPADGRAGELPAWPLSRPTKRELELWAGEWQRPQAVMWERNGQEQEVAMFVRSLVAAEKRDATVASRTLVRQQQEALGLSLPGLARLRWRIGVADTGGARGAATAGRSVRDRLKVVSGGAA